jgi:hypothetical protein
MLTLPLPNLAHLVKPTSLTSHKHAMHSETKNYAQEIQCHAMPATMITTLPTLTLVLPSLSHHVNYARLTPLTLLAQALAQESKPTPGTRRAHDDRTC